MFRFSLDAPEAFQEVQENFTVVDTVQEPFARFLDFSREGDGLPACRILEECPGR